MDAIHQLEITLILFFQTLGGWLEQPMKLISVLGYEEFFMIIMPSFYWCIDAALGFRLGVMLLLSNGVNTIFKFAFHSPRPYWFDPRVKAMTAEASFGVPSGHAQTAAGMWGLLATSLRHTRGKAALLVLIILIGLSRLYLGVHFISDVLMGWLLGGLLLWAFLKAEKPVVRWLRERSFPYMLSLSVLSAMVLGIAMLVSAAPLLSWHMPSEWQVNALITQPESEIDPLNIHGAFTIAGTWFGMMAGAAWLYHRHGWFDASGTPQQRLLRYLVGVAGILVLWFLLGKVFPNGEDAISFALRFLRYTLIGLWVSAAAPVLFTRMGLCTGWNKRKGLHPLSPRQNPL